MALIRATSGSGGSASYTFKSYSITTTTVNITITNGYYAIYCTDNSHPVQNGYFVEKVRTISNPYADAPYYATISDSNGVLSVTKAGSKNITVEVYSDD